jgi:hypothetical protein
MDSGKFSELLTQVFSRFLISGIVFYLFVIYLPSIWFLGITRNSIINNFTFILLVSIVVGLLLDISKFYRISFIIINRKNKDLKKELERSIVKAFKIEIEEKDNINYGEQILKISTRIQDAYIRAKHPDIFHRIDNARIYPDIISMTLFCVLLFLIVCGLFIVKILVFPNIFVSAKMPGDVPLVLLIISMFLSIITIRRGKKKVKRLYEILNDFTKHIIGEGYYRDDAKESRDRFLKTLEKDDLIVRDGNNWKVMEDRKESEFA